jgi:hypothetical protein
MEVTRAVLRNPEPASHRPSCPWRPGTIDMRLRSVACPRPCTRRRFRGSVAARSLDLDATTDLSKASTTWLRARPEDAVGIEMTGTGCPQKSRPEDSLCLSAFGHAAVRRAGGSWRYGSEESECRT